MTTATATPPAKRGWGSLLWALGSALLALAALAAFLAWMGGSFRAKVPPGEVTVPHTGAAAINVADITLPLIRPASPRARLSRVAQKVPKLHTKFHLRRVVARQHR